MKSNLYRLFVVLAVIATSNLQGCATITKGSSQNLTIETEPSGAACELEREGLNIGFVNPTPGTVPLSKDKDTIFISCSKKGYLETHESLSSSVQGMTFGNILLGGIIGLAIDAGTGAMRKYPETVKYILLPSSFKTEDEKNKFFDKLQSNAKKESEAAHELLKEKCSGSSCKEKGMKLDQATEARLKEIENQRNSSKVST